MKVAVVEFNNHHDEVIPSVVYALNELGVEPDVYVTERAIRNDAFAWASGLRYRLEWIDGSGVLGRARARVRGTPSQFRRYDALFVNSVEPLPALEKASRIDLPTVGVVHNAELLQDAGPYAQYFADPKRQPIVLGRHVAASLGMPPGKGWLGYFVFGDVEPERTAGDDRTTLCVPGNVKYVRRDYGSLVSAVETLASEDRLPGHDRGQVTVARWPGPASAGRGARPGRPIRLHGTRHPATALSLARRRRRLHPAAHRPRHSRTRPVLLGRRSPARCRCRSVWMSSRSPRRAWRRSTVSSKRP